MVPLILGNPHIDFVELILLNFQMVTCKQLFVDNRSTGGRFNLCLSMVGGALI